MARSPLLSRLLRQRPSDAAPGDGLPPAPRVRRVAPSAADLRRERKALLRLREERLRDLGGLALEMYRRDRFREDLVLERCAELIGLEARVHELDALLATASPVRRAAATRCACGAPLLFGSRYCANCGRPSVPGTPVPGTSVPGTSVPGPAVTGAPGPAPDAPEEQP
jgi:hypothetical protein